MKSKKLRVILKITKPLEETDFMENSLNMDLRSYTSRFLYFSIRPVRRDYPEEIRRGILSPLAKPTKKNERVKVRPIILLLVLRKIITITLISRCCARLKNCIPPSQVAYQSGRSTTEQVFAIKILAEKAITFENYDIFLLLLDMSKVFDTVNHSKLMNILQQILSESELHMFTS